MLKIYHFLQKTNQYFVTDLYIFAFFICFFKNFYSDGRKYDKI